MARFTRMDAGGRRVPRRAEENRGRRRKRLTGGARRGIFFFFFFSQGCDSLVPLPLVMQRDERHVDDRQRAKDRGEDAVGREALSGLAL